MLSTLSPKAKYRISCARESLETAAHSLEETSSWLDMKDMSQTQDLCHAQQVIAQMFAVAALLDAHLEDMV